MVKTPHIRCEDLKNNIFKILPPLRYQPGGQKALKFEKNTFFHQNPSLEREPSIYALFFIAFSERGMSRHQFHVIKKGGLP